MRTADLDYDLPDQRIAQEPLAERDSSRLLVVDRSQSAIRHLRFADLPALLGRGDLLVRNVSRVRPARVNGRRTGGGRVELLVIDAGDEQLWRCLARPAGRLRDGDVLVLDGDLEATIRRPEGLPAGQILLAAIGLEEHLEQFGRAPLPPYIRRPATAFDRERYQTTYATEPGSCAAPTAGLHFTDTVFAELADAGVEVRDVELHVGPGTFLPIRVAELADHDMHAEEFAVPEATLQAAAEARAAGARVVAVGTTAARALESAAAVPATGDERRGRTRLFIRPGYRFEVVTSLLTNFHQPRSTPLAMVAALIGLALARRAYDTAQEAGYRFLSYGDAMLIR